MDSENDIQLRQLNLEVTVHLKDTPLQMDSDHYVDRSIAYAHHYCPKLRDKDLKMCKVI